MSKRYVFERGVANSSLHFLNITGGGHYIYIEASQPAKVNHSAQLLSPLISGPKCFRFYYHMYGRHIGRLDVLLQIHGQPGNYLMWRRSGEQGNQWREANVDIGYAGEFQVRKPSLLLLVKIQYRYSTVPAHADTKSSCVVLPLEITL